MRRLGARTEVAHRESGRQAAVFKLKDTKRMAALMSEWEDEFEHANEHDKPVDTETELQ